MRPVRRVAVEKSFTRRQTPVGAHGSIGDLSIRHATQVEQHLAAGADGRRSSGLTTANDILVGVIDAFFDEDHPAWGGRMFDWDYFVNAGGINFWVHGNPVTEDSADATTPSQHGGRVAAAALADDPNQTNLRLARRGQSPKSSLAYLQCGDRTNELLLLSGCAESALARAYNSVDVDVLNLSSNVTYVGFPACATETSVDGQVDRLVLDKDTFVGVGSGNGGVGAGCNVGNPGLAAGSFTVGAYKTVLQADR